MTKSTISAAELAKLTAYTQRRVYQLAQDGHIPQSKDGLFPRDATISAVIKYLRRDDQELKRERLMLTAANRKQKELELAKSQGKYIEVKQAEFTYCSWIRQYHSFVRECVELGGPQKRRDQLKAFGVDEGVLQNFHNLDIADSQAVITAIEQRCHDEVKRVENPPQNETQNENTKAE